MQGETNGGRVLVPVWLPQGPLGVHIGIKNVPNNSSVAPNSNAVAESMNVVVVYLENGDTARAPLFTGDWLVSVNGVAIPTHHDVPAERVMEFTRGILSATAASFPRSAVVARKQEHILRGGMASSQQLPNTATNAATNSATKTASNAVTNAGRLAAAAITQQQQQQPQQLKTPFGEQNRHTNNSDNVPVQPILQPIQQLPVVVSAPPRPPPTGLLGHQIPYKKTPPLQLVSAGTKKLHSHAKPKKCQGETTSNKKRKAASTVLQPIITQPPVVVSAHPPYKQQPPLVPAATSPVVDDDDYDLDDLEPGYVCDKFRYYCTQDNDTVRGVAAKLGTEPRRLIELTENTKRFGPLKSGSLFRPFTYLRIPGTKYCSKWKLDHLKKPKNPLAHADDPVKQEQCVDCGISSNPAIMLLCDGCDSLHHTHCVGLGVSVPAGDWFCTDCLSVLQARRKQRDDDRRTTTMAASQQPPPHELAGHYRTGLEQSLRLHRERDLKGWNEIRDEATQSSATRIRQYQATIRRLNQERDTARSQLRLEEHNAMCRHGVRGWNLKKNGGSTIELADGTMLLERNEVTTTVGRPRHLPKEFSSRWCEAKNLVQAIQNTPLIQTHKARLQQVEKELKAAQEREAQELSEDQQFTKDHLSTWHGIELQYAQLLGENRLNHEGAAAYKAREHKPRFLGLVVLSSDEDVIAMNMLREPDELIITVLQPDIGGTIDPLQADLLVEPVIGKVYGVFGRQALFDKERDDELPLLAGVRTAQRRLFRLLRDCQNNGNTMIATESRVPATVRIRTGDCNRCFDLSELVDDCDVDLDLPKQPTPSLLEKSSVKLHDYQQSSLRWMLDKELEGSTDRSMGLAGELWHRVRFLDGSGEYFFCELTGSFALNIFDFGDDIKQMDASLNRFSMPTGGVLAEETGLGKTVITIALIASNPPPLQHRVLPREYIWSLERKVVVNHSAYLPPLTGLLKASTDNNNKTLLVSNATLIIVPMTLLSQWEDEVRKIAPHWSITVLHSSEGTAIQTIATSDIVLATSSLLQQGTVGQRKILLQSLKRIHWHRLVIDEAHEAHMSTNGNRSKSVIATLSATHRHAVTGTPIGSKLSDLYGQIRFLRIAPFCRPDFWKNLIEEPFYEKDGEALRILRSLLSRIVIRHSKRQVLPNGKSLLALPPRTIETVLLSFGNESEKDVYLRIEQRNRDYFLSLKKKSAAAVAARFVELGSLLTFARQACAHSSTVSLQAMDQFNKNVIAAEERRERRSNIHRERAHDKTRAGLLEFAVRNARTSARIRMRFEINRFQHGARELLECPVCFDVVGEEGVALPACAHPICSQCVEELFEVTGTTREAKGHCPSCRDVMRHSEVTFLSDATDAGTSAAKGENGDLKPAATSCQSFTSNGFQMTQTDIHSQVSKTDASTPRAGRSMLSNAMVRRMLDDDRALMHTLETDFLERAYHSESQVGTKIARLLWEISEMAGKNPISKCVVFSQFHGMLDVAAEELKVRGVPFARIDDKMKQHERADSLAEFNSNPHVRVFLLSMRSGAVGLTLTTADHCFILDIAQNSAIEEQAIDRIHRIGQLRPVTVKRFVMKDTVEERILGARRSLAQDKPSSGTQISGTGVLDMEEASSSRPAKRARTDHDGTLDSGQRQQRVEMLASLFGCAYKQAPHQRG